MQVKNCPKCNTVKNIEDFSIRNKKTGSRISYCIPCHKLYQADHYQKNKAHHDKVAAPASRRFVRRKREELIKTIDELKSEKCTDCKNKFSPWIMQYDHRETGTKIDNVATMVHNLKPLDVILAEISKCDLVCANCHADRTYQRRNSVFRYRRGV